MEVIGRAESGTETEKPTVGALGDVWNKVAEDVPISLESRAYSSVYQVP